MLFRRLSVFFMFSSLPADLMTAVLRSLGLVLFGLGDLPGAIRHYEDSLRLRSQMGDPYAESEGCKSLGTAYLR
jgi:hypothetical protein